MTEKPIQYFSREHIERAKLLTPEQVIGFLEDFRSIYSAGLPVKSKLISMRVPENLLNVFKAKAQFQKRPYQNIIKELMRDWAGDRDFANENFKAS